MSHRLQHGIIYLPYVHNVLAYIYSEAILKPATAQRGSYKHLQQPSVVYGVTTLADPCDRFMVGRVIKVVPRWWDLYP